MKKAGVVALIGRPNVGKSTLLNNLLQRKVAITSPRPQTTRFPLQALYEDERGQILFVDTPGIFGKVEDTISKKINAQAGDVLGGDIDLVLYIIDHTRGRDLEENKTLGLVRKYQGPKILLVNKMDVKKPDHWAEYAFYTSEFDEVIKTSALARSNLNYVLDAIFERIPKGKQLLSAKKMVQPGINLDSKLFLSEIIREKAFLFTRDEVPYTIQTQVDEVNERENGTLYVKGQIITTADRYKKMLIGREGIMIKKIGMAVRKELEVATNKHVYVELTVEVNPHWQEQYNPQGY